MSRLDGVLASLSAALTGRWVPPVALLALMIGGGLMIWGVPLVLVIVGVIMVIASPLWAGRERLWATIGLPLCSFMILNSIWILRFRVSVLGVSVHTIGFSLFAAATLAILIVLWIRGARRAASFARGTATTARLGEAT